MGVAMVREPEGLSESECAVPRGRFPALYRVDDPVARTVPAEFAFGPEDARELNRAADVPLWRELAVNGLWAVATVVALLAVAFLAGLAVFGQWPFEGAFRGWFV